jgi:hypothetical protein
VSKERTQFKKGVSGNPSGRKKANPIVSAIKETSYIQFLEGLQKYGALSRTELQAELQRPDATMFEIMFGQIVASAAKGDKDARQVLLDRLWGKVKDKVEYSDVSDIERDKIKRMSMNELIETVKTLLPEGADVK